MNRSKQVGTAGESAVVAVLRASGFPQAERRALAGAFDLGDVTGTPGLVWEVKAGAAAANASDGQVRAWLRECEVERQNADAHFGLLVMKRAGIGVARADEWWAVLPLWQLFALRALPCPDHIADAPARLHLSTVIYLLRDAGYGDALPTESETAA